jgi:hypothetical protein
LETGGKSIRSTINPLLCFPQRQSSRERIFMHPSDQDLIECIRKQDTAAFDTLFDRYRDAIRRHIARTVRDDSAAEDPMQKMQVERSEIPTIGA